MKITLKNHEGGKPKEGDNFVINGPIGEADVFVDELDFSFDDEIYFGRMYFNDISFPAQIGNNSEGTLTWSDLLDQAQECYEELYKFLTTYKEGGVR